MSVENFGTCSGSPVETFTAAGTQPSIERKHLAEHQRRCFALVTVEPSFSAMVDTRATTVGTVIGIAESAPDSNTKVLGWPKIKFRISGLLTRAG